MKLLKIVAPLGALILCALAYSAGADNRFTYPVTSIWRVDGKPELEGEPAIGFVGGTHHLYWRNPEGKVSDQLLLIDRTRKSLLPVSFSNLERPRRAAEQMFDLTGLGYVSTGKLRIEMTAQGTLLLGIPNPFASDEPTRGIITLRVFELGVNDRRIELGAVTVDFDTNGKAGPSLFWSRGGIYASGNQTVFVMPVYQGRTEAAVIFAIEGGQLR